MSANGGPGPADDEDVELLAILQFVRVATDLAALLERFIALAKELAGPKQPPA